MPRRHLKKRPMAVKDMTRIAVAGYGLVGKRHVDVLHRFSDLSVAAVVEPNEQRRTAAAQLGIPVFPTLSQMLDQTAPDGVVLATPTPLHVEQGLTCVARGCPILIEKPIGVRAIDAYGLIESADRSGVPLLVGHHRRYNGIVQSAKQALDGGEIGEIRSIQATCWLYKPDHYFETAPWRKRKGAGPISVNLVHDIDLLRYFCGEVSTVQAVVAPTFRGFENENLAAAILTFGSGAVATISVSDSIAAPWSWELTARENPAYPVTDESCYLIGGSAGSLSLPDLRLWRHAAEPDWWTPISADSLEYRDEDPLCMQMAHFSRVIKRLEPPLVSGVEGIRSLEVVEAVAASANTGGTITLDDPQGTGVARMPDALRSRGQP